MSCAYLLSNLNSVPRTTYTLTLKKSVSSAFVFPQSRTYKTPISPRTFERPSCAELTVFRKLGGVLNPTGNPVSHYYFVI